MKGGDVRNTGGITTTSKITRGGGLKRKNRGRDRMAESFLQLTQAAETQCPVLSGPPQQNAGPASSTRPNPFPHRSGDWKSMVGSRRGQSWWGPSSCLQMTDCLLAESSHGAGELWGLFLFLPGTRPIGTSSSPRSRHPQAHVQMLPHDESGFR